MDYVHARFRLHSDLVDAIAAGDASTARALIAEHKTSGPAG